MNRTMGMRDQNLPDPIRLMHLANDPGLMERIRVARRMRADSGSPLTDIGQVDAIYEDLYEEPLLRLEYDRFCSGLIKRIPMKP